MSVQYGGDKITFADGSSTSSGYTFRNRIINGDMRIDQRNTGNSITGNNGVYTLDRWYLNLDQNGKFNLQQNAGSVTPPAGFTNYLGCTSTSAYTVGASETFALDHKIEGYNMADFAWGTANAKTVTLSFWVYSSLTGTFGGSIQNNGRGRNYVFSYTINNANTWEQKSITIPGDTSGTWLTNNGIGMYLNFSLGNGSSRSAAAGSWGTTMVFGPSGAVNLVGTNAATWYLTGVQFEVGSSATTFEVRDYTRELQMCQRYYEKGTNQVYSPANGAGSGQTTHYVFHAYSSTTGWIGAIYYKVIKRTAPTVTYYNSDVSSGGKWAFYNGSWNTFSTTSSDWGSDFSFGPASSTTGLTAGQTWPCAGVWAADAEL